MKKVTGEELEECIFRMRSKLYRLRDDQWKERGTGNAKLLRSKVTKKIRFVMRQEKTLKPVANFFLQDSPLCDLVPMKNNDKAFLWSCTDCSDEEARLEKLCARFQTAENTALFKAAFEAARLFNQQVKEGKPDSELVFAPTVDDPTEIVEDDSDKNVTADAEGGAGGDDEDEA